MFLFYPGQQPNPLLVLPCQNKSVCIVSALANEASTVKELVRRTLPQLKPQDKAFFILDKKSQDDTFDILQQLKKEDDRILPIFYKESKGMADAYIHGYTLALKSDADVILEMDGGLSHEPEEIPTFLQKIEEGFEYVGGSRFIEKGIHHGPINRQLVSKIGTLLSNLVLGTQMTDMTGGFQCYTKQSITYILEKGIMSRSYFFQTEIRYFMHTFKWTEIPIHYHNPNAPSLPSSSITESFKSLWKLYKTHGRVHS